MILRITILALVGIAVLLLSLDIVRARSLNGIMGGDKKIGGFKSAAEITISLISDRFLISKCIVARILIGAAILLVTIVVKGLSLEIIFIGSAVGVVLPEIWNRIRISKRVAAIELHLPMALDALALSVEAGQDFSQALSNVAAKLYPSPLKDQLQRLDEDLKLGRERRISLEEMAKRCGSRHVASFSALLIQAAELGTSIGPILKSIAARLRSERLSLAERKAAIASQIAMLPLTMLIMPSTFIVVFGPLIVRLSVGGVEAILG